LDVIHGIVTIRIQLHKMEQYAGPYFNVTNPPGSSLGHLIANLRVLCLDYYASRGAALPNVQGGNCVLNNLDELDQSNAASHTYFLTLWPAFISIIVAMGPDGNRIVYDDILWSGIFTLTCGALPGYHTPSLPHQHETVTLKDARRICEYWQDDETNMRKSSRRGKLRGGIYASEALKIVLALLCLCFWAAFVTWYLITLGKVFYYGDLPWYYGGIWYLVAGVPHLCEAVLKIMLNNVELYEPIYQRISSKQVSNEDGIKMLQLQGGPVKTTGLDLARMNQGLNRAANFCKEPLFFHKKGRNGIQTWLRIAYLQIWGERYRILVKPNEPNFINSCFDYCCRVGQLTLFVWGCMAQGSILLVPTPTDYGLVAVLVFATVSPRIVWPHFWRKGKRGADLVVWYRPAF
jgi:hypothetical protein